MGEIQKIYSLIMKKDRAALINHLEEKENNRRIYFDALHKLYTNDS